MEPLPPAPTPGFEAFFASFGPVNEMYAAGDRAGATRAFLHIVLGPRWEALVAPHMPEGWLQRAIDEIDGFFTVELPAVEPWLASQPPADRIQQPVLSVLGADSHPYFAEVDALLRERIPGTETLLVPGATHGLQFMNPKAVTEGFLAFLAKHPMRVPATA
jgi:pimeloyl-ACP methyl ester carboxylesterase